MKLSPDGALVYDEAMIYKMRQTGDREPNWWLWGFVCFLVFCGMGAVMSALAGCRPTPAQEAPAPKFGVGPDKKQAQRPTGGL